MNPSISVVHATLARPAKAIATMMLWQERCTYPDDVEYLLVTNDNDGSKVELKWDREKVQFEVVLVDAMVRYSAPAWNCGALAARGEILIQGQDDVEPPMHWDKIIRQLVHDAGGPQEPVFVGVGDGYRKGDHGQLCTTAIMTRAYRDLEGFFLCPLYRSVFSDDEVSYRALRNARDGKAKYVDAKDVIFLHQHHYHVKDEKGNSLVPWDDTYAHENAATAYAIGEKLFRERNPRAATDGIKKW